MPIKGKDQRFRETLLDLEEKARIVKGLEEQTEKLINALKK
jgi:hypothetical protein